MPEVTVKYGAVAVIFFMSGLSLNISDLKKTIVQVRLHMFIQLFTFLFVPICIRIMVSILRIVGVNEWVLKGYEISPSFALLYYIFCSTFPMVVIMFAD